MKPTFTSLANELLQTTVSRAGGAPGVVAMATDRATNFYEGAAGVRELGKPSPMTTDTVVFLASCTKAVTGIALMQLVEEGLVSLTDPARKYLPQIGEIQVLDGFDAGGEPLLRKPKSDITLDQLMLHTAGFAYDFFPRGLAPLSRVARHTVDLERDLRWSGRCAGPRSGSTLDLRHQHRMAGTDNREGARQATR